MKRLFSGIMLVFVLSTSGLFWATPTVVHAQNKTNAQVVVGSNKINPYDSCETGLSGLGDFGCQIGMFVIYGVWYRLSGTLASVGAFFADHMLWFSLQSSVYESGELMATGWGIVRNVINIGFIAALLYTGIMFIIGKAGGRILIRIVLSALLVNFSLFGARLIIDIGNITARAIYTQIKVTNVVAAPEGIVSQADKVQISQGILNMTDPQTLLFKDFATQDNDFIWKMFTMFFFSGILNIFLIFIFLSMALLFVTRTVSLILLGILVPIPIIVDLIPHVKSVVQKLKGVGSLLSFDNWLTEYAKLSAMAPVYCFFLYLIIMVNTGYTNIAGINPVNSGSIISVIFTSMLPIVITFFLIRTAANITKDFSGAFGAMVTEGVSKVVGMAGAAALAVATGGASLAGGAIGKSIQAAGALTSEERDAKLAAAKAPGGIRGYLGGKYAALKYGTNDAEAAKRARLGTYLTEKATYDPRNIRTTGAFKSFAGSNIGKAVLGETSNYAIAGVNFGEGSQKSYSDRDKNRSRKEAERVAEDTAAIHHAMEAVSKRREAELERKKSDPKTGEARKAEILNELNQNNNTAPEVGASDVLAKAKAVDSAKSNLKSAEDAYRLVPDNNVEAKRLAYKQVQKAKQALAKAEDEHKDAKFRHDNMSHVSIVDLESKVTSTGSTVDQLTREVSDERKNLASEEEKNKKRDAELADEAKKIDDRKKKLADERKAEDKRREDLEKLGQFDNTQKELYEKRNKQFEDDKKKIDEDEANFSTKQIKSTTDKASLKDRLDETEAKEKQLEDAKRDNERCKKAVEERKKKQAELEASIDNRSYLDDDAEALAHAKTAQELKQRYVRARTPEDKAKIMQEIGFHSEFINEFKKANDKNDAALMTLEKALIGQLSDDKKFMQHHIAEEAISRMQNTFGDIGSKIGIAIGTGVGAAAGATLVGALTGGPIGAALAAGLVTTIGMSADSAIQSTIDSPAVDRIRSVWYRDTGMQITADKIRSTLR